MKTAIPANREYFEKGCLCIRDGVIEKQPPEIKDFDVVYYYEQNCICSRNYVHLEEDNE